MKTPAPKAKPTPAAQPAQRWKASMPYPTWPFARVSGRELQKRQAAQTQAAALANSAPALL